MIFQVILNESTCFLLQWSEIYFLLPKKERNQPRKIIDGNNQLLERSFTDKLPEALLPTLNNKKQRELLLVSNVPSLKRRVLTNKNSYLLLILLRIQTVKY